jgi:hypothetical protein
MYSRTEWLVDALLQEAAVQKPRSSLDLTNIRMVSNEVMAVSFQIHSNSSVQHFDAV